VLFAIRVAAPLFQSEWLFGVLRIIPSYRRLETSEEEEPAYSFRTLVRRWGNCSMTDQQSGRLSRLPINPSRYRSIRMESLASLASEGVLDEGSP
jgi:hypothetical protein